MPEEPKTTTVEVKMNTWAALDKLKERGDSFNDVIQRLLDNAAVDVNTLDGAQFEPIYDDVEPIPDGAAVTEGCAQVDPTITTQHTSKTIGLRAKTSGQHSITVMSTGQIPLRK